MTDSEIGSKVDSIEILKFLLIYLVLGEAVKNFTEVEPLTFAPNMLLKGMNAGFRLRRIVFFFLAVDKICLCRPFEFFIQGVLRK